jgi:hypothetical protein
MPHTGRKGQEGQRDLHHQVTSYNCNIFELKKIKVVYTQLLLFFLFQIKNATNASSAATAIIMSRVLFLAKKPGSSTGTSNKINNILVYF